MNYWWVRILYDLTKIVSKAADRELKLHKMNIDE